MEGGWRGGGRDVLRAKPLPVFCRWRLYGTNSRQHFLSQVSVFVFSACAFFALISSSSLIGR